MTEMAMIGATLSESAPLWLKPWRLLILWNGVSDRYIL